MKHTTINFYVKKSIVKAQEYIQHNLNKQVSTDKLAEYVGISRYHFHRIYYAYTGESLQQYARRIRLENSAMLLQASGESILNVAFDSGYETHESFTRAFKKHFGISPKSFRELKSEESLELISDKRPKLTISEDIMDVSIKLFGDIKVAYLRHIGPYEKCEPTWAKLCSSPELMRQVTGETLFIGISYDDPNVTEPDKIRYDACISVGDDFVATGELKTQTIPAGEFAVLRHVGSYQGFHAKYQWLYGVWLPNSGREPHSAPLEIYRNNPQDTPEDELITDICIPLV